MKKKQEKLSLISAKLDIYMILLSVYCFVQNKLFKLKFCDSSKDGWSVLDQFFALFLICSCPVLNLFLVYTCTVLVLLLLCSAICWSMATCIHLQRACQPVYIVTFPSVAWITCIAWVAQRTEPLDGAGAGKLMLVSLHWWYGPTTSQCRVVLALIMSLG